MSVDVEDWFQVENLKPAVARDSWNGRELRVEQNTDRILQSLEDAGGVRATFFVLGWVAERCPGIVRRIAEAGHEVASHGHGHEVLDVLTPPAFRADVERSKATLEDLTGAQVRGYRAPSFSIKDWALPILQELGFLYDSSAFPTFGHDRYGKLAGITSAQPVVELAPGFFEVSVSCLSVGSHALPWGGGGYFRLLPYGVFLRGVRRILASGRPYVFYLHPWEIDPEQPRIEGLPRVYRFRHYVGLERCQSRLESLLRDLRWTTMDDLVRGWARPPAAGRQEIAG